VCAVSFLHGSGFLRTWYELYELQVIRKDWKDGILEVRDSLPDWNHIVKITDSLNLEWLEQARKPRAFQVSSMLVFVARVKIRILFAPAHVKDVSPCFAVL